MFINFPTNNILLVLAVIAVLLSFAASLYEKIAKQKKLRILVAFISAGAIITVGTLILNNLYEKNRSQISNELESKKQDMIDSISANVSKNLNLSQQSLTLLEHIKAKFAEVPLGRVAVKLTSPEMDGLKVFDKAHPSQIPRFVNWLDRTRHDQTPAIGFTVNANRTYRVGLTLGYLLANQTNFDLIMEKLNEPEGWNKFPDNDTLKAIDEIQSDLKYVLFYDGSKSRLLGFADANLFARELLVLKKQGRMSDIEELLRVPGKASVSSMKAYFTSFSPRVLRGTSSYDVAQEMINEKFNDGVLLHDGTPWFVSLANMIKLAT